MRERERREYSERT